MPYTRSKKRNDTILRRGSVVGYTYETHVSDSRRVVYRISVIR